MAERTEIALPFEDELDDELSESTPKENLQLSKFGKYASNVVYFCNDRFRDIKARRDSKPLLKTQDEGHTCETKEHKITIENLERQVTNDLTDGELLNTCNKKLFILSIKNQDIAEFKRLLEYFLDDINWNFGRDNNSSLHYAAREGSIEIVEHILQLENVQINKTNRRKQTPLYLAAEEGHYMVMKLLIDAGADPQIGNDKNNLPLHAAAFKGNIRSCHFLAEQNPRQISVRNVRKETPLICAAMNGYRDCCAHLIDDINVQDKDGNTALHWAAKKGYFLTVRYLLENGADYTLKNKNDCSPTYLAASHSCKDTLEVLLPYYLNSFKEDYEMNTVFKRTIFHSAANSSVDCLKLLANNFNVDIFNVCDSEGNAPIHFAVKRSIPACAELLINLGVKFDLINNDSKTVLHLAAKTNQVEFIGMILAKDRSMINKIDKDNLSPLLIAVKHDNIECCKLLIKKCIRLTATDNSGKNALHLAVERNNASICRILTKADVSIEEEDYNGNTPFQSAVVHGSLECCKLLLQKCRSQLTRRNSENRFLLELAFENKRDVVFNWVLDEMAKVSTTGIDKFIFSIVHRCMHAAIDENRMICIDAIVGSRWWNAGFRMYPDNYFEPASEFLEDDIPCTNLNSLIKSYPDQACAVMNNCIQEQHDFTIYNYEIIENSFFINKSGKIICGNPFDNDTHKLKADATEICDSNWMSNHVVNTMVEHENLDLLKHPLVTSWINNKWLSYIGIIVAIQFVCRVISAFIVSALLGYMTNWEEIYQKYNLSRNDVCNMIKDHDFNITARISEMNRASSCVLMSSTTFILLTAASFEIFKYCKLEKLYSRYWCLTLMRMIRVVLIIVTVVPINSCDFYTTIRQKWQWEMGVVGVLFYWLQVIIAMNNIPSLSICLPVTTTFVKNFIKVLIYMTIILASFAYVFHLMMYSTTDFKTFPESVIRTVVWLQGGLTYDSTFLKNNLYYDWLAKGIFVFFVTSVAVFITNLLISSPLNYINKYIQTAELHKYDLCVNTCLAIEVFFSSIRKKWVISQASTFHRAGNWRNKIRSESLVFSQKKTLEERKEDSLHRIEKLLSEIIPQLEQTQEREISKLTEKIVKIDEKISKFDKRISKIEIVRDF